MSVLSAASPPWHLAVVAGAVVRAVEHVSDVAFNWESQVNVS